MAGQACRGSSAGLFAGSAMIGFYQECCCGRRAFGWLALATAPAVDQSAAASLSGEVRDYSGARVSGVAIAVIGADGRLKFTVSDHDGRYLGKDLLPGRYTAWAWSKGFALYENNRLLIRHGRHATLDIPLEVGIQEPRVPGRELLFRIAYAPARNPRQDDQSPRVSRRPAC